MLVRWEIDIDAETPLEGAQAAHAAMTRPDSIATVFVVIDDEEQAWHVDLLDDMVVPITVS